MPIYTGKSRDGSDMQEAEGAYVNPDNPNEWSAKPYPKQRKAIRIKEEFLEYVNGRYSLRDVYWQIQNKNCTLSKRVRDYVLSHFNEDGEFINQE